MCECCVAKAETFNVKVFGMHMVRATVNAYDWLAGQFGLVHVNGPTFTFETTPVAVNSDWLDETKVDNLSDEEFVRYTEACAISDKICDEIKNSAPDIGKLVDLYKSVNNDENFSLALMDALYKSMTSGSTM